MQSASELNKTIRRSLSNVISNRACLSVLSFSSVRFKLIWHPTRRNLIVIKSIISLRLIIARMTQSCVNCDSLNRRLNGEVNTCDRTKTAFIKSRIKTFYHLSDGLIPLRILLEAPICNLLDEFHKERIEIKQLARPAQREIIIVFERIFGYRSAPCVWKIEETSIDG